MNMHARTLLLLSLIFGILTGALNPIQAQTPTKAFYKEHKKKPGVFNLKVPAWLIWVGGGLAYNIVEGPEEKAALKLAKKVKGLRLMRVESNDAIERDEINYFLATMRENAYEDLIYVKEDNTKVQILGLSSNKKLKEMIILVEEEDAFTYITAKTNLKSKDISRLINTIVRADKEEEVDEKVDRKTKRKRRRALRKAKKIPQA
jgi:hypothetical protein